MDWIVCEGASCCLLRGKFLVHLLEFKVSILFYFFSNLELFYLKRFSSVVLVVNTEQILFECFRGIIIFKWIMWYVYILSHTWNQRLNTMFFPRKVSVITKHNYSFCRLSFFLTWPLNVKTLWRYLKSRYIYIFF